MNIIKMQVKQNRITPGMIRQALHESFRRILREGVEGTDDGSGNGEETTDAVLESDNDGDYQHYKIMIPTDKKEPLDKLLRKASKNLPDLEWKWASKPRKKYFRHIVNIRDGERMSSKSWMEEHELYDLDITYPVSNNGWQLLATVDHGALSVTDTRNGVTFSNPEHGVNYRKCDACGRRTEAMFYIVRNKETGEEMQVGSGCARKYGLDLLKYIYALESELYPCLTLRISEFDTEDKIPGRGGGIKWRMTVPMAVAVNAAMAEYMKHPEYVKGMGGTMEMIYQTVVYHAVDENPGLLNKMIDLFTKYPCKDYEYYKKHKNSDNPTYRIYADETYEDSFDCKIYDAILGHKWLTVRDFWIAFFAVRKFKQLEEADKRDVSRDLSVGDVIQINGVITKASEEIDPYYGRVVPIYWIKTDDGYNLKRKGVIPFDSATKRVENVYAAIKWKSDNGEIYLLDRVTKHPKKGARVVNLREGRRHARLRRIVTETVRRTLRR